jgi:phytoene dehydrogenase-like protein
MNKIIPQRWLKEWSRCAPNMIMDNLIETHITTPDHVVNRNPCMLGGGWGALDADAGRIGKLRPFREISDYRMPVKNYYLCSSAAHPAHGTGRGSCYNCYKMIVQDHPDIKYRPWERKAL